MFVDLFILFSALLNISFLVLILRYIFIRKYYRPAIVEFKYLTDINEKVLKAALIMARSKKSFMSFSDEVTLYAKLSKLKSYLFRRKVSNHYVFYNFPRAFLLIGLHDFAAERNRDEILNEVILQSEKYIDSEGNLKFKFDKVDQSLFGVLFIRLYNTTNLPKYLTGAKNIYKEIESFKNSDGFYLYRKNINVLFVDTLGMVLPFLYEIGALMNSSEIMEDANKQILYYHNVGFNVYEQSIVLPFHAYDLDKEIPLGSMNWSRGIGWFMIGLAYATKYNKDSKFLPIFNAYWNKLEKLTIDNYWPQFLGHTNEQVIDSSATLMLYYSKMFVENQYDERLDFALKKSISNKGFVENSSGDTWYINRYSKVKSKSELCQGILLIILSRYSQELTIN